MVDDIFAACMAGALLAGVCFGGYKCGEFNCVEKAAQRVFTDSCTKMCPDGGAIVDAVGKRCGCAMMEVQ